MRSTLVRAALFAAATFALLGGSAGADAAGGATNGRIAFASDRDGTSRIYTMNADGSDVGALTAGPNDTVMAWSPDGQKLVFDRSADDGSTDLYVVNADGSGERRLTTTGNASMGAWSPDGARIAYTIMENGPHDIGVINADGTGAARITDDPDMDDHATWSADGRRIAFESYRSGTGEIWSIGVDGRGLTQLTSTAGQSIEPEWSPDGARIAFASDRTGTFQIYTMNADGTGQTQVSSEARNAEFPSWSPDGTMLLFTSLVVSYDLVTTAVDGSGRRVVEASPSMETWARWQPVPPSRPTYAFSGFSAPVENLPTVNVAQAGRAIPVRFSLGGDFGLDVLAPGSPSSQRIACDSGAPLSSVTETINANQSSLSYDAGTGRYSYVWKTDAAWSGTCRQLDVTLADGSSHRAVFRFK